jgi:hypothetical protein
LLEYHSILITLVRVTLHFYSFLRYVGSCLLLEFEDTANELLSSTCNMQDIGVDTSLGDSFECQPMRSAHRLPTSIALSAAAYCSYTFHLRYLYSEEKRTPRASLGTS